LSEPPVLPDFGSGEEFAGVMAGLAGKLHANNRIWLGESGYAWLLARLVAALGEDFREVLKNPEVALDFGDAYRTARLDDAAQVDALLARLRARLVR